MGLTRIKTLYPITRISRRDPAKRRRLRQPPEYYHPHYITHEVVHFFQWTCCRDDREYSWPTWVIEGMAESDGYRHTSEYSRTTALIDLADKVREEEMDGLACCYNLAMEEGFVISSPYWVGGWVMNYLAEESGEEIHIELLRNKLSTVLTARGLTVEELFEDMAKAIAVEPERGTYTAPEVVCTGRYSQRDSGTYSFEVRILNNRQRPEDYTWFYQQHRIRPTDTWTAASEISWIGSSWDQSNFSSPLFTGPSSSPISVENTVLCSRWVQLFRVVECHQLDCTELCQQIVA